MDCWVCEYDIFDELARQHASDTTITPFGESDQNINPGRIRTRNLRGVLRIVAEVPLDEADVLVIDIDYVARGFIKLVWIAPRTRFILCSNLFFSCPLGILPTWTPSSSIHCTTFSRSVKARHLNDISITSTATLSACLTGHASVHTTRISSH